MSTSSTTEENKNEIIDDLSEGKVDLTKLAALKAKSQAKQENKMAAKIIAKKERSLNLGIIGSGQGGGRLAASFAQLGYDAVAINTASQDLKYLALNDSNKLLLEYGLGGAAKELEIGREAAATHADAIMQLVGDKLPNAQVHVLCLSLGGGSGAGSSEVLVDLLASTGKPLVVMTILPMDTDDAQTKSNSLETLSRLTKLVQSKKINNLIVVDNAKLEAILAGVSQMDFFDVANKSIVGPIDIFNSLSMMPSAVKSLDSAEWSKLLVDGEGLTVYGELTVEDFLEDTAIAEAVLNNLDGNLLAGGFDLKQSRYVGVMIVANREVSAKISNASISYAMSMINEACGSPKGVFKGIYVTDMPEPVVKVYSMFSGLLLPEARVEQLKKEAKEFTQKVRNKDENRTLSLKLDTGTEESVSAAQRVKDKIAAKSSAFGKLMAGNISDRRK